MEYLITALEITVALFAVIGIYSLARLFSQRFFGEQALALAIEIYEPREAERAEELILAALEQFLLIPSGRIMIVTTFELAKHPTLQKQAKRYGVPVRVMSLAKEN